MTTLSLPAQMPATTAQLTTVCEPRPIRRRIDYDRVTRVVDRLAVLEKPTRDQADYLEVLTLILEAYKPESHRIDTSHLGPLDTLRFLMTENGMSGSDLGRLLGVRQLGAQILSGKRQLSKTHIRKLADHFGLEPGVFLP